MLRRMNKFFSILLVVCMLLSMMPATVFAATPTKVYLKPNSEWLVDNARFAAYFFGAGEAWVSMTDPDGDGYFEAAVPSGGYTSVIFCRMNPTVAANTWDYKWNQTSDLTLQTSGANCWTLNSGSWAGEGKWSTYSGSVEYYLFGYINGANYACEEDAANLGTYKFASGKLTVTFTSDSYVAVRTNQDGWYMTKTYDQAATSVTLYATGGAEKMFVPGGVKVTFTLKTNSDGTLTLSYSMDTSTCAHKTHNTDGNCTVCGKLVGHSWSNGECSACGASCDHSWKSGTCEVCGLSCSHSWDSGKVTTAATCTGKGTKTYTCKTCGSTKTETIAATGHSYTATVTAPTCTAGGYTTHTCSKCGDSYKDSTTAATGHSWGSGKVTTAATCTKAGVKTYTCSKCKITKTETIAATGHSYTATVTAPTCTAGGYTTHTCSKCGDSYKDSTTAATGHNYVNGSCTKCGDGCTHSYDSGKVTTAATCTKTGVKTYTCSKCGGTKTETIAATGHSYTSKVTAPTCTAAGYTTYTCSKCGDSYTGNNTSATGHSWDSGKVTTAATCTKAGVKTYTCSKCKTTKTETIAATGHSYTSKVTAPTCTAGGYTTYTCSKCGDSYTGNNTAAKGHSYSNGKCSVCGTACNHSYSGATCTICGLKRDYYLFGYINGANYACEEDDANIGIYKFVNGKLTVTFESDSYVAVKTGDNLSWYMTNGYPGDDATSATLYNTNSGIEVNKLRVPGGTTVTFTLTVKTNDTLVLSYSINAGSCQHLVHDTDGVCTACGAAVGHSYVGATCTGCGLKRDYYLFGYINGANYACEEDDANIGIYKFVNGKLTVTFESDSYVAVKTGDNLSWYMTNGYPGDDATSATLYNTNSGIEVNKLRVPGGTEVTFTLVVNDNDTLVLSYAVDACEHLTHGTDGKCTACGATVSHSWGSGVQTKDPTCTAAGVKTYTCTVCGGTKTESVKALGHSYTAKVTAPTCTADGYTTYTCSKCGDSYTGDPTTATGHSYVGATCTGCGLKRDYYLFGYINGANYACEEDDANIGIYKFVNGKLTVTFESDSYVAVKTGDNLSWYMTNGYPGDDATSATLYNTNSGIEVNKLRVPGGTEVTFTLVVNDNDTLVLSYAVDACEHLTHGTDGKCTACGATVSHSWGSGVQTKDPTCTAAGVKTYTCTVCGGTKTESVKALGHSYTAKVTAPTCTADGYTTYTCSNCGDSYTGDPTTATGHSYVNGICANCGDGCAHSYDSGKVTTAATCTAAGVKTYTCSKCGGTKTETIAATGHSYTAKVTAPTCTAGGYTTHTCSKCGDSYKDSTTAATGHSWSNGVCGTCGTACTHSWSGSACTICGMVDTARDKVKIHLVNTLGWNGAVAYLWTDVNGTTNALSGYSWPGVIANRDADGYFTLEVDYTPKSGEKLGFLFHDFNGGQTADMTVSYATLSANKELWVKPDTTADSDGKFPCTVATAESGLVISPEVNGTQVTFRYQNSAASKVYLAGSFNSWSSSGTKLTKGSNGVWSVTLSLTPGVHEYKFVVDGEWELDPCNGTTGGYDGNSIVVVSEDNVITNTGKIKVVLHFYRETAEYDGWDVWFWDNNADGSAAFTADTGNKGMIATYTLDGNTGGNLGYVIRKSDWSDQEFYNRFIDLSDVVSGTVHYYVTSGVATGSRVLGEDVIQKGKPSYANYDYDAGTAWLKTSLPLSNTAASAFTVVDSDGNATNVTVKSVTLNGNGYTVSLSRRLNLSELNNYQIRYSSTGVTISINTHNLFYSSQFAADYTYHGDDLGATWSKTSTTFKVWAPTAKSVSVKLYDSGNYGSGTLLKTVTMTLGSSGVWSATVSGDLNGVYYNYDVAFATYTVEATDPYADATGANGDRGMVIDFDSTDPDGWDNDISPNRNMSYTDAIIYEMHIREMTIDASSGVKDAWKGKYLGMTQTGTNYNGRATGLDHLKELGVTHVQLMPAYDFSSVDEYHLTDWQQYAWGYDPKNFSVPEGSYSTDPFNGAVRVKEFKEMVQTFHENGINVVMDVVYNHYFDGGNFCGNKIVPNYYSRFYGEGNWSNGSGCGNDAATERVMVRNMIVDSIMQWVKEYHVDGFRFDLSGLIDTVTINEIVNTVHSQYPYVMFYGEGWAPGGTAVEYGYNLTTQGNAWEVGGFGFFNDGFRNAIAGDNGNSWGFASGSWDFADKIADSFRASNGWSTSPTQTINYASCHDNYCLMDKIIISRNGAYWEEMVRMNNLSAALVMMAQGTPFIYSGEELLREKKDENGNRYDNAYGTNDYINKIRWSDLEDKTYAQMTDDYFGGLIDFRKNHAALRCANGSDAWNYVTYHKISDQTLMFYISGYPNYECSDGIVVIFNASTSTQWVNLGNYGIPHGYWQACIHGTQAGATPLWGVDVGSGTGEIGVEGISTTVLVLGDLVHEESVYNQNLSLINCSHSSHTTSGLCNTCGASVSHTYSAGKCTTCGRSSSIPATMTVYYDNTSTGWSSVNAYTWASAGGKNVEFSGNWPGSAMTNMGGGIYAIELSTSATNVIFNDGSGNQSANLNLPGYSSGRPLYDPASGTWKAYEESCTHASHTTAGVCTKCGLTVEHSYSGGVCTVCGVECDHSWNSGTCYTCGYVCSHSSHTTSGKCAKCDVIVEHSYTTSGSCSVCGKACVHSWNGTTCTVCGYVCGHSSHTTSGLCNTCGSDVSHSYVSGTCTKCGLAEDAPETITIYFDNSETGWENVYAYAWTEAAGRSVLYTDAWPGSAMTLVDGNIYSITISRNASIVIFNNISTQTGNLSIPAYTTGMNQYNPTSNSWTVYTPDVECEHRYASSVTTAATCTETGVRTYTCFDCGDSYTESIPALGHNYVDGTCANCGEKESVEPESYAGRYYIATIRTSGNYFYMTNSLGTASTKRYQAVDTGLTVLPAEITEAESDKIFVLEMNADGTYRIYAEGITTDAKYLGHTSGNSGTLVSADAALALTVDYVDGVYNIHYTASDAERYLALNNSSSSNYFAWYKSGQKQNLVLIPVTGAAPEHQHTVVAVDQVDATCTADGTAAHWYCSDAACPNAGILYSDAELTKVVTAEELVIPALGHSYVNGTCTVCGEDDPNVCSHNYVAKVTAPTCTEAGYTTYTCSKCGDSYTDDPTAAAGHRYASSVTTQPTCTDKGVKTFTCFDCGHSYTEDVASTGHSYSEKVTAPTCTTAGYTTHTCATCGDVYTDNTVAATGHSYSNGKCSVCGATAANVESTLAEYVQDGTTLHCWNWSIANIEANMGLIANMGYTSIQLSPMQEIKEGTTNKPYDNWWVLYQPISFNINESKGHCVGTRDEFIQLCKTAHKYDIKVIVDVVSNHLANDGANALSPKIDPDILNDPACWHDYTTNSWDYSDRYNITQYCMAGLPDLNTGNKKIQNYVLDYLKDLIDCGADGFRFDAAKQIETPSDHSSFASDFWPTVVGGAYDYASSTRGIFLYCYGEMLQNPDDGGNLHISAYTEFMSVTENVWSNDVRNYLNKGNAGSIQFSYFKGCNADKLVLWPESHDTFADDSSNYVPQDVLNRTWAIVASRAYTMALYFPRANSMNGQELGEIAKTGWSSDEVRAVNRFHNQFIGTGEYCATYNGYAYVERGGAGVVIVSSASAASFVSVPNHTLAAGTYKDQITGNTFTVSSDGWIYGDMGSTGIAVVCNAETVACSHASHGMDGYCYDCYEYVGHSSGDVCAVCGTTMERTLYFRNTEGWSNVYLYAWHDVADGIGKTWPGTEMTLVPGETDLYQITVPVTATNVIFHNGDGVQSANLVPSATADSYNYGTGMWTVNGQLETADAYYLFGSINGADYNGFDYPFVNGSMTVTFTADSYVFVCDSDGVEYMTEGWVGTVTNTKMYPVATLTEPNKLFIPGNVEVTINLTVNADGSVTVSYTTGGCSHNYASSVTKAATCTEAGIKTYTCFDCGHSYTESIPALGHSYDAGKVTTEATCTEAGVKTYTCGTCGETKTEAIAATGHSYSNGYCFHCGAEEPVVEMMTIYFQNNWMWSDIVLYYWGSAQTNPEWPGIPMELHDNDGTYDIYALTIPADITGLIISGIKNDGSGERDKTPDITEGFYDGICYYMLWENDGNVAGSEDITVILPEENTCEHRYASSITTQPTCTEPGVKTYTCFDCGHSYTESIAATGHDYKAEVTAPTCEDAGYTTYKCACGDEYVADEVAALGHSYDEGKITTDPTCTEDGVKTYTCGTCGETKTESVAASGHSYVDGTCANCGEKESVEPESYAGRYYIATIRTSGNYFYMTNSLGTASTKRYQAVNTGLTVLPAEITEAESDKIFVLEMNADGTYRIYAEGITTDAKYLGHTSGNSGTLVNADAALALTVDYVDGVYNIHYTASDAERYLALNNNSSSNYFAWYKSGQKQNLVLIPVTGAAPEHQHTVVAVDQVDATCTADGTAAHWYCSDAACPNAGILYSDAELTKVVTAEELVIPALGHSYDEGKVTTDPTCTEDGVKTYTCGTCGETKTEAIAATGHSYSNGYCFHCGAEEPVVEMMTIYFQNNWMWSDIVLYYWGSAQTNPEWPGIPMELHDNDGTYDIYALTIPADITGLIISGIKNDGSGERDKTPDITEGFYDGICYYMLWENDGNVAGSEDITVILPEENTCEHRYASSITTQPTCTEPGVKTYTCFDCGHSYTESIAATGHDYKAEVTAPTCEEAGYTTYTCACGDEYVADEVAALGHSYDEGKITTDPTCTEDGVKTYTCGTCGETKTESVPSTGHSYVDGTCTACGAADPDYVKPVVKPNLTLSYPTLNFKDVVYYNVYYQVSDMTDVVEMGLITFDGALSTGTIDDAAEVITGYIASGSNYMVHTNGINAKNLGDALYFKVYAKLSDGSYVYSDLAGYHAVAYAKDILTNSANAKMKSLVVAMLNYGAAAQVQFEYKTDSLMNSFLTEEQKALVADYSADMVAPVTKVDSSKIGSFAYVSGGYSALYPSVSFEGAFSVKFYFTPAKAMDGDLTMYYWSAADYAAADVLTAENATGVFTMDAISGTYVATVEGIAARQIDETIYVAGIYESNGVSYPTGVIAYSLGTYCLDRVANGTGNMPAFAKATIVYGYYAKAYFAQ